MNQLTEHACLFIRVFDDRESQLTHFERELQKIADEVKVMQKVTDKAQLYGAVCGVIGLGLGIITAPFTWGTSLVATTGAVVGGGLVVGAYITGSVKESRNAEKVKHLGGEILEILEPMWDSLEEIKMTCDNLEQKSEERQAKDALSDVEELQRVLGQVSELKRASERMFHLTSALMRKIRAMAMKLFMVTATPKENFPNSIISNAHQYQKVVCELRSMRKELSVFTGETAAGAVSD